jgi:hypothetical protein
MRALIVPKISIDHTFKETVLCGTQDKGWGNAEFKLNFGINKNRLVKIYNKKNNYIGFKK